MGFKFRKRITLFPGCTINLSKSGVSTTLGPKGFSINVGKKGTYLNTGIPGTGLYDRIRLDAPSRIETESSSVNSPSSHTRRRQAKSPFSEQTDFENDGTLPIIYDVIDVSSKYSPIPETSAKWRAIKNALVSSQKTRAKYRREEQEILQRLAKLRKPNLLKLFDLGGSRKTRDAEEIVELEKRLELLQERSNTLDSLRLRDLPSEVLEAYRRLVDAFRDVCLSRMIWNVVNETDDDLSPADMRFAVDFRAEATTELDTSFEVFQMKNARGDSLYVYPTFLVLMTKDDFALIDFADLLSVSGATTIFRESGDAPSDAKIIGTEQVGNVNVTSAQYYSLSITSKQGLDETFVFSAMEPARRFCGELANYRRFCTTR